jgi:MerR family transcriptional regulator, light-induced transcriptional regulator
MVSLSLPARAKTSAMPHYRASAVARMLEMPVATLRIWESRYQVSRCSISPAGHRLYTPADVQRLALIKHLTAQGHAISALAKFSLHQLQQVATDPAQSGSIKSVVTAAWSVVVVGSELGRRLSQASVQRRLGFGTQCSAVFETLEKAALAPVMQNQDALLVRCPSVQNDMLRLVQTAARTVGVQKIGVVYSYASSAISEQLLAAGVAMLREPHSDTELAQWLRNLRGTVACVTAAAASSTVPSTSSVSEPRFNEATLIEITRMGSSVACECPSQLAQLLIQLAHFGLYSAQCAQRSPSDALLHTHLAQVTASARVLFEDALQQVARHEGLDLEKLST